MKLHVLGLKSPRSYHEKVRVQRLQNIIDMLKSSGHKTMYYRMSSAVLQCHQDMSINAKDMPFLYETQMGIRDGNLKVYCDVLPMLLYSQLAPGDIILATDRWQQSIFRNMLEVNRGRLHGCPVIEIGIDYSDPFAHFQVFETECGMRHAVQQSKNSLRNSRRIVSPPIIKPSGRKRLKVSKTYLLCPYPDHDIERLAAVAQRTNLDLFIVGGKGPAFDRIYYAPLQVDVTDLIFGATAVLCCSKPDELRTLHLEAASDGTPIITNDANIYRETLQGLTGCCCKTIDEYVHAVNYAAGQPYRMDRESSHYVARNRYNDSEQAETSYKEIFAAALTEDHRHATAAVHS